MSSKSLIEMTRNISFLILLVFIASCKLTETSVSGRWASNHGDTLTVDTNHRFQMSMYKHKESYSGTWSISKHHLMLKFDDSNGKKHFGNCGGLQQSSRFRKYRLVRPWICPDPTHEFVFFDKIHE
jgi:hypothetical protein